MFGQPRGFAATIKSPDAFSMKLVAMEESEDKRVVVAVDESEESMYALSWCLTNLIAENHHTETTLILLYVRPAYSSLDLAGDLLAGEGDVMAAIEKRRRALTESVMTRAAAVYRSFGTRFKVEKKVGSGDAKDVICAAAAQLRADVLVMGSHDYGFVKRMLLGSVSDYCVKHVKCPVVVVKRPKRIP